MGRKKLSDNKFAEKGHTSTTMLTRKSKELQEFESRNRVFGNPLLMDKIVKYSIYNSNGKDVNNQTIVVLRLVNKSCLQSTSRMLAKSGEWSINLQIGTTSSTFDSNGKRIRETILDEFVSVFSKASRFIDSVLPVNLHILPTYFLKECSETLSMFLEQCSDVICALTVVYPRHKGSMNLKWENITFAILRHFEFLFERRNYLNDYETEKSTFETNTNSLKLIRQVMQTSPSLQRVSLLCKSKAVANIGSVILPVSIKTVKLTGHVTDDELTLLTKNRLPNLHILDLEITEQNDLDVTYKILQHFQKKLTSFSMEMGKYFDDVDRSPICIKFPLMEKLKCLKLFGESCTLFPELRQVWPKYVPNLAALVLQKVSETLFMELVQGSRFENARKLKFSLVFVDEADLIGCSDTISPNVQIIKEIITSFPKLERLTIHFKLNDIRSLKYIFQNCTHLKKLKLSFQRADSGNLPNYKFLSIFVGISCGLAKALVERTAKDFKIAVENPKSIMNLTELNSLTLVSSKYHVQGRAIDQFCSEFISKYGLNKMPKLQKIKMLGGFEVRHNDET